MDARAHNRGSQHQDTTGTQIVNAAYLLAHDPTGDFCAGARFTRGAVDCGLADGVWADGTVFQGAFTGVQQVVLKGRLYQLGEVFGTIEAGGGGNGHFHKESKHDPNRKKRRASHRAKSARRTRG